MKYQIHNGLTGTTVKFRCEKCGTVLRSPLKDAGTQDTCPECGTAFIVPGAAEKERHEQAKRDEAERKAEREKEAQARKELKQREEREREKAAEAARAASAAAAVEQLKKRDEERERQKGTNAKRLRGAWESIALMCGAFVMAIVALSNLGADVSGSETVFHQVVFAVRFYGALTCSSVLFAGAMVCNLIGRR